MTTGTLAWYAANADRYAARSLAIDLSGRHRAFAARVKPGGRILDIGCGAGRDAAAFALLGFEVEARDPCVELLVHAGRHPGVTCRVGGYESVRERRTYDGIWSCASLLHVPRADLPDTCWRLGQALRPGGTLMLSVKEGDGEETTDGRRFSYMREGELIDWFFSLMCVDVRREAGVGSDGVPCTWLDMTFRNH